MSDIPPELQPDTPEQYQRRRRTMWLGIGIPTFIGAILAFLLGVPWWIIAIFIAVLASGVLLNT